MLNSLFTRYKDLLIQTGLFFVVCGLFSASFYKDMANHGIIILAITGLLELVFNNQSFKKLFQSPLFTPFILIFLFLNLTLLYTTQENSSQIYHYFEKRLIFFALPLAFIALPVFNKKYYNNIFILFFTLTTLVALWSVSHYITDIESITDSYYRSGIMPTLINHVRFSLMVTYAIVLGFNFIKFEPQSFKDLKMIVLCIATLFLITYLHVLAVRSGLLSFYFIAGTGIIYYLFKKNYLKSFSLLCIMAGLIFIAFSCIKTFQARWGYTMYDLKQSSIKESANNYSLSKRFVTNQVGYKVFKSAPVFGTGEANLEAEIHKTYEKDFPYIMKENYLAPHNQFLTILAGTGIIGFLLFWTCFYFPLFKNGNYKFFPLWSIYIILTVSFLAEDTLQTQLGFIFGLFFIMINLHQLKEVKPSNLNAK